MRKLLFAAAIILGLSLFFAFPAYAAEGDADVPCLPGVYAPNSADCLHVGPADYLSQMSALGITFPLQPLPASSPDSTLGNVPYNYARVTAEEARVYASLEDAIASKPVMEYMQPGFSYVSYIDLQIVEGKKYYHIAPGKWMRAGDLSGNVAPSIYQGLAFHFTPLRRFGWILYPTQAQRTPGFGNVDFTGLAFNRWDVIQVYDTRTIEGVEWYMVGPDQWVAQRVNNGGSIGQRQVSLVYPDPNPPAGVDNGRWVEINLYEQTVAVYENFQLVYAMLVSSGAPGFWTRPGLFQIYEKHESTPMSGAFEADRSDYYYLEDVPFTMYFDEARALHGAYWHNNFGYVTSHGCANLANADARWLFDWGQIGDWVYVWDPSGETPTDPSLYGSGGA